MQTKRAGASKSRRTTTVNDQAAGQDSSTQPTNENKKQIELDPLDDKSDDEVQFRHRKVLLCDPAKGQLFPNYDKIEDWDEFDSAYQDLILKRFSQDCQNRMKFTNGVNKYYSRLARINGSVNEISPGKQN